MARLSERTVHSLSPDVRRPNYARLEQAIGIVHFGIGAFHRAHQAVFTDAAMSAGDRNWGILGVSPRSPAVRDALGPQDGVYTVTERSSAGDASTLVGSVRDVVVGNEDPESICAALADPATRIVSLTITEKGYGRAADGGLDVAAPAVSADLRGQERPSTVHGYLERGLLRRREAGRTGLSLVSCDNLAENGRVFRTLLLEFLDLRDASLARWVEAECAFPSTMVDRIVPATTGADLASVERHIGLRDEGAVVTEPFSQWVIENCFVGPRPRWEAVGATLVDEVHVHEMAKLRILNAAHSALAYLGLARGHSYVHEAISNPSLRPVILALMEDEAAPTLPPTFDAPAYVANLLPRFANEALPHRLEQIATDGSQKIAQRWLSTLAENQRNGLRCPSILEALAAWMHHVRGGPREVADPIADRLAGLWRQAGNEGIAHALFGTSGLFPQWTPTEEDVRFLNQRLSTC